MASPSGTWRRNAVRAAIGMFALLGVYRGFSPAAGQERVLALLLGATMLLFLLLEHTTPDTLQRIRDGRRQMEAYTAISTALITGVIVLLAAYLATYGVMTTAYLVHQTDILVRIFFELLQHIRLFEAFHPLVFAAAYVTAASLLAIGVLIIYPFIPIQNGRTATVITFLISWAYTFSLAYLAVPIIHPLTLESLVIDAFFVVLWAFLFHNMYDKPVFPNPFLKRLEKHTTRT